MSLFGTLKALINTQRSYEEVAYPTDTLAMSVQQTRVYGTTVPVLLAFVITLPSVAEAKGQVYIIRMVAREGTEDITVEDNNGDAGFADIVLDAADEFTLLLSDGKNWYELDSNHA